MGNFLRRQNKSPKQGALDLVNRTVDVNWTGLGRKESGIKEAIKVKLKHDKHGMGHNAGDEFTFHWWDHVFNKAASSISVEDNEHGIKVKKVAENGPIKNKKTRTFCDKKLLYGQFVKGATLDNNVEMKNENNVDYESSSDDEQVLNKLDDSAMMKICGGMTAHKAARHGLKLNGKLLRLEEQEKVLLEKYGKKSNKQDSSKVDNSVSECQNHDERSKKKKKKKKKDAVVNEDTSVIKSAVCDIDTDHGKNEERLEEKIKDNQRTIVIDDVNTQSKKRKRKSMDSELVSRCWTDKTEDEALSRSSTTEDVVLKKKKKKCKK